MITNPFINYECMYVSLQSQPFLPNSPGLKFLYLHFAILQQHPSKHTFKLKSIPPTPFEEGSRHSNTEHMSVSFVQDGFFHLLVLGLVLPTLGQ